MNTMQTRPIPDGAVDVLKNRRVYDMEWQRAYPAPRDTNNTTSLPNFERSVSSGRNPLWQCTQAAAAAFALLTQPAFASPGVGEFLAGVDDSGISRPMLDIDQVKCQRSRAAASMQPLELSHSAAKVIKQSLASGSAQPKIKIAPLPQYNG